MGTLPLIRFVCQVVTLMLGTDQKPRVLGDFGLQNVNNWDYSKNTPWAMVEIQL